jgi:toxin ParE1/3/4
MSYAIEFAAASERDFELIFDHLFSTYRGFGDSPDEALERAARRILALRADAARLTTFPIRGTSRTDILPGLRYVTVDKATYWFVVDESARRIRILAVFFGGQDHLRHMLVRLLSDDASP